MGIDWVNPSLSSLEDFVLYKLLSFSLPRLCQVRSYASLDKGEGWARGWQPLPKRDQRDSNSDGSEEKGPLAVGGRSRLKVTVNLTQLILTQSIVFSF